MAHQNDRDHLYKVAARNPPKPSAHQDLAADRWERKDVDDCGVILAVQRGWVATSDPAHRLPTGAPADSPVCRERCLTGRRYSRPGWRSM